MAAGKRNAAANAVEHDVSASDSTADMMAADSSFLAALSPSAATIILVANNRLRLA